ncbi:MAG: STAS/SEC14 domain-containing protein [Chloroflexota bacterium]
MTDPTQKPLHYTPDPDAGFSVDRREDGGMNVTFSEVTHKTLSNWHQFAVEHLIGSDRLVRNLYDLRQVEELSDEAIQMAIEVNNDPSTRNIRLAAVVANDAVRTGMRKIIDNTPGGGVRMSIFEDMDQAEAWLIRPMASMV